MKIKLIFSMLCLALVSGQLFAEDLPAPSEIERTKYIDWAQAVTDKDSPFFDYAFNWFEREKNTGLPQDVFQDKENIFIRVDAPLQETIRLENKGDTEAGITYGMEVYAVIPADIDVALEAFLFRAGKPVGKDQGETYPFDGIFNYRKETTRLRWGSRTYENDTTKTQGGFVKDMRDSYAVLVRGDRNVGYNVTVQYMKNNGDTATKTSFGILLFRPMAGDRSTAFKVVSFYQGQSYSWPDISFGRRQFGFNPDKDRSGQKEYFSMVEELRDTGTIKQRTPNTSSMIPVFPGN